MGIMAGPSPCSPHPQVLMWSLRHRLQVSRNDWGSALFLGALDMIFSAAQHSNAAIAEMVSGTVLGMGVGASPDTPCLLVLVSTYPAQGTCPMLLLVFGSLTPSPQAHYQEAGTLPSLG